jgi:spore maturation protein CgeB
MENAIRTLGHELFVFDDRQHIVPGRVRQRIKWLHQFDLIHINKKFISLASEKKPDIAIVTGGHRITASTVRVLKEEGICSILWTIDPPINFQPIIDVAPLYDHIFCQGTEAIELLDREGIQGANWLPVACDPEIHHPVELSEDEKKSYGHDIVFIGSYYPRRAELFESLVDFDFAIYGPGWHQIEDGLPIKNKIRSADTTPIEWVKVYSASKIILAPHYQDPHNRFPVYQASPRIFEALACKRFILVDRQRDVLALFRNGEHLVYFNSADELREKCSYYLSHFHEREEIAARGYQEVLGKHTFVHRIQEMFSVIQMNR